MQIQYYWKKEIKHLWKEVVSISHLQRPLSFAAAKTKTDLFPQVPRNHKRLAGSLATEFETSENPTTPYDSEPVA
jgi:hypothetical protein